ncbi:MAG: arylformamidase [Phenylobacterium sp.]|uniref:arylformamidase n=1 Tax=Phenylobacterium sp. TaxID=1871053 RepID=UPI00391D6250
MSERDELGRRIWDISQPLRPGLPVWPGDTPYEEARTWHLDEACPVNVSRIVLSTHSGAHADAPLHYDPAGEPIGSAPLSPYLGPAQLIEVRPAAERIAWAEIEGRLADGVRRVLLRTYERFPHEAWRSDFATPSPELIDELGARGVVLIGLDSPSLDPETAKDLVSHKAVRRHRMAILEGLVLDGIPEGLYELIAPPLKLANADAAPVRALLRELHPSAAASLSTSAT